MTVSLIFGRCQGIFMTLALVVLAGLRMWVATILPAVSRSFGDGVVDFHKGVKEFS